MDLVWYFAEQQVSTVDRPALRAGDIIRVTVQVQEGGKSRLQTFEGTLLSIRGSGPSATITVRRETGGFGIERIFQLYSPLITSIDIVKRQKVRRAKLTYLRESGRRRFKEDVKAMQRHIKEEEEKKRLAEAAEKKRLAAAAAEAKAAEEEAAAKTTDVQQAAPEAGAADEKAGT